ncbi:MAG: dihydroorotate dehydrogenase [Candidatus Hodarchaeales archaeon]
MSKLYTKIGNIKLRNPLILASGVYGSTYSSLARIYNAGLGAVVTKSIGIKPRDGYPNPSVIYLPEISSVINAFGLANSGYIAFADELINLGKEVKFVISLFGSRSGEFKAMIQYFQDQSISPIAYELNLSCPHAEKVGMAVGTDPDIVKNIVCSAKQTSRVPIWVKLTPNITNIVEIAEASVTGGADVIVAINTLKAILIDINIKKPVLSNIRGGLSGRAIKPIGIRMIYDLYEYFRNHGFDVPLIGVGGIFTWQDVIEYVLAGASAVQVGSVFSQPYPPENVVSDLINGLERYLEKESLNFNELKGLAHE